MTSPSHVTEVEYGIITARSIDKSASTYQCTSSPLLSHGLTAPLGSLKSR